MKLDLDYFHIYFLKYSELFIKTYHINAGQFCYNIYKL